jgi:Right handed beta helix region
LLGAAPGAAGASQTLPVRLRPILALTALAAAALPAGALADPPAGRVEVVNDAGALVGGQITGNDAIEAALARIRSGPLARADDTRPWRVVVGAGTYGDVVIDEPNLTVVPSAGAAVGISTSTGKDVTGGECIDVTRGNVTVQGIVCRSPRDRGIEVLTPPSEGGVVLRQVTVDRARFDGIAVIRGAGATIVDSVVSRSGRDGVWLQDLTAPGPWVIQGGQLTGNGDDGVDLVGTAQRVRISGVTIDGNKGSGVESDDAGSTDLVVDGARLLRNGTDGATLGGGGTALRVLNSTAAGNGRYGVDIGRGSGFAVQGDTFDGGNRQGDLAFSPDARAGGVYGGLGFVDTALELPGEPRGVILRAVPQSQRVRLTRLPSGLVGFNRLVGVRDTGRSSTSVVTLRFALAPTELAAVRTSALAVYEDDPPGNKRTWQAVPGTRLLPGGQIEVTLTDAQIASGSDARFATYGPLAPPNLAPVIAAVYPAQGARVRGRTQLVSAAVGDDEVLSTGRFALYIDGRRRGGVRFGNGNVIFRVGGLSPGTHRASLMVVDQSGVPTVRAWSFTVLNGRPSIQRRRALPRPGSFVLTHGIVRLRIPVRDDQRIVPALTRVRVDGRRVRARVVHGRLVARVRLAQGRHRIVVRIADRDGAVAKRGWAFRTVRP